MNTVGNQNKSQNPGAVSALDETAARWAHRFDAGLLTAQERMDLEAWTAEDSRHAGAFARALAANSYLERAISLGLPGDRQTADEVQPEADDLAPASARIGRRGWLLGGAGALAASLAGYVVIDARSRSNRISTALGAVQRTSLADGSSVTLNSSSKIDITLDKRVRQVNLLAGEVNFDVARDGNRPFIVQANDVQVRVLGTSFIVRLTDDGGISVTVREGLVAVSRADGVLLKLGAGDCAALVPGVAPDVRHLSSATIDAIGLWQRGEINLTGMTLADAAAAFSRYSGRRIEIPDPAVGRLKVAGVFAISDPSGFAHAVAESMDLDVRETSSIIELTRRNKNMPARMEDVSPTGI